MNAWIAHIWHGVSNLLLVYQVHRERERYSKKPIFPMKERGYHIFHLWYPVIVHNILPWAFHFGENPESLVEISAGGTASFSHSTLSSGHRFHAMVCVCVRVCACARARVRACMRACVCCVCTQNTRVYTRLPIPSPPLPFLSLSRVQLHRDGRTWRGSVKEAMKSSEYTSLKLQDPTEDGDGNTVVSM